MINQQKKNQIISPNSRLDEMIDREIFTLAKKNFPLSENAADTLSSVGSGIKTAAGTSVAAFQSAFPEDEEEKSKKPSEEERTSKIYNIFIAPFADVLKASKLYVRSMMNIAYYFYDTVKAYDREDLIEATKEFNNRRKLINQEWNPIIARADKSLSGMDPLLKLSLLGPSYFILQGFGAGLSLGRGIHDVFARTPWRVKFGEWKQTQGLDLEMNFQKQTQELKEKSDEINRALERIFLVQRTRYSESKIRESFLFEQEKTKEDIPNPEDAVKDFMKATGLDAEFNKIKQQRSKDIINLVNDLEEIVEPFKFVSELLGAKSIEELSKVSEKMKNLNQKISLPIPQINSDLDKNAKILMTKKEFIEDPQILKMSDIQKLDYARGIIFEYSRQNIIGQIVKILKNILKDVDNTFNQIPIDSSILALMKKDSDELVRSAAKVYEDFEKSYKEIKAKVDGLTG